jgi:hypothetical protein
VRFSLASPQRPAADIFLAGVTQTPPTVYVVAVALLGRWPSALTGGGSVNWRAALVAGFSLNAPLIFLYPVRSKRPLAHETRRVDRSDRSVRVRRARRRLLRCASRSSWTLPLRPLTWNPGGVDC